MLLLQFININKKPAKISGGTISLGHDKSNDIVIDEPGVSDFHAEISIDPSGITLSDLLSEYGTFVNGIRISRNKALQPWDRIKLASVEIEISESEKYRPGDWALKKESDLLNSQYIPLQRSMTVGRNPECDLVILDGLLSRKHAVLTVEANRLRVEDLNSANGTFINHLKIDSAYATPGDEITFDKISFELLGPSPDSTSIEVEENTIIRDEQDEEMTLLESIDGFGVTSDHTNSHCSQKEDVTSLLNDPDDNKTLFIQKDNTLSGQKTELFTRQEKNTEPKNDSAGLKWAGIGFLLSLFTGLLLYYALK